MLLKLKYFSYILITIPFLIGHAPWGQHQVYRQMHMLIMCSKIDKGAYLFTKKLEKTFNIYLPDAKARVARAPHLNRIIDLLKTNNKLRCILYKGSILNNDILLSKPETMMNLSLTQMELLNSQ